jgi:Phosphoadenosine phosphosulfate reductase family
MTLFHKINAAQELIRQVILTYHKPIVMSSFGKDSMCLLDLIERTGETLPILFHREPCQPSKYAFANSIIEQRGYTVHDYPPISTQVVKNGDKMDIVSRYQVGEKAFTWLGRGIRKPEPGKPFLCGLKDMYDKPVGLFKYPWDVALVGHKNSDVDSILGPIPLKFDIKANPGACDFAYPLRHFTDADVWEYIEKFDVPYNQKRYNKENGYKDFPDITFNNDYYLACVKCMDRDEAEVVDCPRLGCQISNVSAEIRYIEPSVLGYGKV